MHICYCSMYIVCPYITHVELYPDVELEISRIETNGGRTDQYRVQFIVSVSDSILRKQILHFRALGSSLAILMVWLPSVAE